MLCYAMLPCCVDDVSVWVGSGRFFFFFFAYFWRKRLHAHLSPDDFAASDNVYHRFVLSTPVEFRLAIPTLPASSSAPFRTATATATATTATPTASPPGEQSSDTAEMERLRALQREHALFVLYLSLRRLEVHLWEGDSMLYLGAASVPLFPLLRQQHSLIQVCVQYSTAQCSAVQVQCSAVQCSAVRVWPL